MQYKRCEWNMTYLAGVSGEWEIENDLIHLYLASVN